MSDVQEDPLSRSERSGCFQGRPRLSLALAILGISVLVAGCDTGIVDTPPGELPTPEATPQHPREHLAEIRLHIDPVSGTVRMVTAPGIEAAKQIASTTAAYESDLVTPAREVVNQYLKGSNVRCDDDRCNNGITGIHTIFITLTARRCLANLEVETPRCLRNCTYIIHRPRVLIVPSIPPEVLEPGESFTVEVEVNVHERKEFEVRFNVLGDVVGINLEQVDDNSPIDPRNRMASNVQDIYRDVQYRLSINPKTILLNAKLELSGTAGVTFSDGSSTKAGVKDGTVVTLQAKPERVGTWRLDAKLEQAPKCEIRVQERVFEFVPVLDEWSHSFPQHVIAGCSTVDHNGGKRDGSVVLEAQTSRPKPGFFPIPEEFFGEPCGDETGETYIADIAQSGIKIITRPTGSFTGKVLAEVRVQQEVTYGGLVADVAVLNLPTGSGTLAIGGLINFSYGFGDSGAGFVSKSGIGIVGDPLHLAQGHEVTTGIGVGPVDIFTPEPRQPRIDVPRTWMIGESPTHVPIQAAHVLLVKKNNSVDAVGWQIVVSFFPSFRMHLRGSSPATVRVRKATIEFRRDPQIVVDE